MVIARVNIPRCAGQKIGIDKRGVRDTRSDVAGNMPDCRIRSARKSATDPQLRLLRRRHNRAWHGGSGFYIWGLVETWQLKRLV